MDKLKVIFIMFCLVLLLSGCFDAREIGNEDGFLILKISIPKLPEVFNCIELKSIIITATNGTIRHTRDINITNTVMKVPLENLEVGNWNVNVSLLDADGFVVYEGSVKANVHSETPTNIDMKLSLLQGDLQLEGRLSQDVARGTVEVLNSNNDELFTEMVKDENHCGSVSFSSLKAGQWLVKVSLFNNSGSKIATGQDFIPVFPGRHSISGKNRVTDAQVVFKPGSDALGIILKKQKVEIRRFPYPYRAMLAIASDIDATTPWEFERIHRFMNTLEKSIPFYGDGVGLDISDSFFFLNMSMNGVGVYDPVYRYPSEEVWKKDRGAFPYEGWAQDSIEKDPAHARDFITGKLVYVAGSNFIEKYINAGWIDFLHGGIGNWKEDLENAGASDWIRKDGEHYLEWLKSRGLKIEVFINHSQVTSNFSPNYTSEKRVGHGANSSSEAYWSDIAIDSGIRFFDTNFGPQYRPTFGVQSILEPVTFPDGHKVWHFSRSSVGIPNADGLHSYLNRANLDHLVKKNALDIIYTHLGYFRSTQIIEGKSTHNMINPELSIDSINSLRLLKSYQDEGKILVARVSRLLKYNLALDYLYYTSKISVNKTIIDIISINDPQFGNYIPSIEDLRGITFYVNNVSEAVICLNGVEIPESEIQTNSKDHTGQESIGIRWFQPDYTDYTVFN